MDQLLVYARKTVKSLNDASVVSQVSHWNVRGPNFYECHLLFGRLYESLSDLMDPLVESLRACGYSPDFAELSGPGISMGRYDCQTLLELNMDYVMSLSGVLALFFTYASEYEDDPRMIALADLLQSSSNTVLQNMYLLQAALGH